MLEFLFGLVITALFMVMPFMACWTRRRPGSEWVPVNDSYKYGSDDNIYATLVSSVRQRGMGFDWPAIDCEGCKDFEILRVGSYRLAALLGAWLPSPRWLHLVAQVMAVLAHYSLVFAFIFLLCGNSQAALCGSFFYLFAFNLFNYKRARAIRYAAKTLFNTKSDIGFDALNDNFRYVILSVSAVYGAATLALLAAAAAYGGAWYAVLGLSLVVLPFSYPGTMLPVGLHATVLLVISFSRSWHAESVGWLLLGIVPASLFLLLTGRLAKLVSALRTAPPTLHLIHCASATVDPPGAWLRKWRDQFFAPPVLLAPASAAIAFLSGRAVEQNVALLITALIITSLGSMPGVGKAISRMQTRGAANLYQAVFFATVAAAVAPALPGSSTFLWVFMAVFGAGLLRSSWRMMQTHIANQTYSIDAARWEMYGHLRRAVSPQQTLACLDISDLQLAPVYGTGTAYVGGGEWLQPPHLSISRQACLMKHCGISPSLLVDWFHNYFTQRKLVTPSPVPTRAPDEDVEGVLTLNHLIFYPYITQFEGVTISEDHKAWTPAFVERFTAVVESGMQADLHTNPPDFILISARQEQRRAQPGQPPAGYERVVEAGGHSLYRLL